MKVCGIYMITSPNKKIYIGQSTNINRRIYYYKNCLCKNQIHLFNSIKKHGWDAHKFEILAQCDPDELNDLEIHYMELYQCRDSKCGLNLKEGGSSGKHSEVTKEKMRKIHTGVFPSNETRIKMSVASKGHKRSLGIKLKPFTDEHLRNMSLSRIGKKASDETKIKMSNSRKGKLLSDESKLKLSNSKKGKKRPPITAEWKANLSEACKGRSLSEEHKRRISEARTGKKYKKINLIFV